MNDRVQPSPGSGSARGAGAGQVGGADEQGAAQGNGAAHGNGAAPALPPIRSQKLIVTLGVAGALAGLLLVSAHQATAPAIRRNQIAAMEAAIREVVPGAESSRALFLRDGQLSERAPEGEDSGLAELYLALDGDARPVGYAIVSAAPGFQDIVRLVFGYEPATDRILGMRVLESKETPGLGDKIEKDEAFVTQFARAVLPLVGVKPGRGTGDEHEIDTITGATISADAVIRIVNTGFDEWRAAIQAYAAQEVGG